MLRSLAPKLAKGSVGFLLGFSLWWALSSPYARLLGAVSEPLMRLAERPAATRLTAYDGKLRIDRSDFPRAATRPELPLANLTANVILLTTLFAVNGRPLADRNVIAFLLAAFALMVVHVAAVMINIESIYVLQLGGWSARNYGPVARNFWGAAAHFYSLIGAFGASFALWWLLRPSPEGRR